MSKQLSHIFSSLFKWGSFLLSPVFMARAVGQSGRSKGVGPLCWIPLHRVTWCSHFPRAPPCYGVKPLISTPRDLCSGFLLHNRFPIGMSWLMIDADLQMFQSLDIWIFFISKKKEEEEEEGYNCLTASHTRWWWIAHKRSLDILSPNLQRFYGACLGPLLLLLLLLLLSYLPSSSYYMLLTDAHKFFFTFRFFGFLFYRIVLSKLFLARVASPSRSLHLNSTFFFLLLLIFTTSPSCRKGHFSLSSPRGVQATIYYYALSVPALFQATQIKRMPLSSACRINSFFFLFSFVLLFRTILSVIFCVSIAVWIYVARSLKAPGRRDFWQSYMKQARAQRFGNLSIARPSCKH